MRQVDLELLEKVRKRLCVYAGDPCDCKTIEDGFTAGEHSGCCEVRMAIDEIRALREVSVSANKSLIDRLQAQNEMLRERVLSAYGQALSMELERDEAVLLNQLLKRRG